RSLCPCLAQVDGVELERRAGLGLSELIRRLGLAFVRNLIPAHLVSWWVLLYANTCAACVNVPGIICFGLLFAIFCLGNRRAVSAAAASFAVAIDCSTVLTWASPVYTGAPFESHTCRKV